MNILKTLYIYIMKNMIIQVAFYYCANLIDLPLLRNVPKKKELIFLKNKCM